jgi:hypothetical protein
LDDAIHVEFVMGCLYLTLPVFATYFALRVKNLIVAAALTWVALCIPGYSALFAFATFRGHWDPQDMAFGFAFFFSYAAFALLACWLLRHSLSRRIYSF